MDIQIREIKSDELDDVYRLTYNEYLHIGYIQPNKSGLYKHYQYLDNIPQTTVWGVFDTNTNKLIGTNSLTIDGPQKLYVDEDFPDQVNRIRRWCAVYKLNLGASWRIITDHTHRSDLKIMLELIRATIRKGCQLGLHVTLYSFNPRHEKIYTKLLGLETIVKSSCRAVGYAHAVLMLGDSRKILSHCRKLNQPCIVNCNPVKWPKSQTSSWEGM